jgi:hypothetical protein
MGVSSVASSSSHLGHEGRKGGIDIRSFGVRSRVVATLHATDGIGQVHYHRGGNSFLICSEDARGLGYCPPPIRAAVERSSGYAAPVQHYRRKSDLGGTAAPTRRCARGQMTPSLCGTSRCTL